MAVQTTVVCRGVERSEPKAKTGTAMHEKHHADLRRAM